MAQIFNIQHEADLSEYDSTITDGGDLSQSGTAALAGTSGGMSVLIDDTTAIYGSKDFTAITSTKYRFRFYIDPNSLAGLSTSNYVTVVSIRSSAGDCSTIFVKYDSTESKYYCYVRYRDDGGSWYNTSNALFTDAEHYIETLVEYASSSTAINGIVTLWVDGSQEAQDTGIDIYDLAKPDEGLLGAYQVSSGVSGTYYLDEFVFRDDDTEIGPVFGSVTIDNPVGSAVVVTVNPGISITGPPAAVIGQMIIHGDGQAIVRNNGQMIVRATKA
ncbi:MAG: hypothetical protein ACYSYL_19885 [Planctomycetota bacterium]|jgi:hypothetical protein